MLNRIKTFCSLVYILYFYIFYAAGAVDDLAFYDCEQEGLVLNQILAYLGLTKKSRSSFDLSIKV